jgi:hypothetical protein
MPMATAIAASSIVVSVTQPLGFGKFAAGSGGSVSISPAGARTFTGGVVLISSSSGSPAEFSLNGTPDLVYSISLPANGVIVLSKAGGGSMTLTQFTSTPAGTGQLNGLGRQTITIGATLNVGAQSASGSYTGSFDLVVDYN